MNSLTTELRTKHCKSCEGGVPELSEREVRDSLKAVPMWNLSSDGKKIRRDWKLKDFATGLEFIQKVGELAENEDHHPDIHLVGYRNLAIELSTHAVGGLTENDFIMAAKIDDITVKVKT
jgi:4a-hydroxytetrahydrobiopterin dehydratase